MTRALALGVLLLASAPLALAGTLDVGPPGSGATYASIHDAVAAARTSPSPPSSQSVGPQ